MKKKKKKKKKKRKRKPFPKCKCNAKCWRCQVDAVRLGLLLVVLVCGGGGRLLAVGVHLLGLFDELDARLVERLAQLELVDLDGARVAHKRGLLQTLDGQVAQQAERLVHALLLTLGVDALGVGRALERRREQVEADPVEHLDALAEEHVPDAQHRAPRQRARIDAHEPLGHVEYGIDGLLTHELVGGGVLALEQVEERLAVDLHLLEAGLEVLLEVEVADAYEQPEGVLLGHVHEEESGDGSLRLTVANGRIVHRVGAQHVVEHVAALAPHEQLVAGKLTMQVLLDVLDVARHVDAAHIGAALGVVARPLGLEHEGAREVHPRLAAHRLRYALAAARLDLLEAFGHPLVEVGQHVDPLELALLHHLDGQLLGELLHVRRLQVVLQIRHVCATRTAAAAAGHCRALL